MKPSITRLVILLACWALGFSTVWAQEEAPEQDSDSREVDFNEENFRRSMELRDTALRRSPDLTVGTYSPGTGIQALD
ncbi:MAG: hypothetical protein R3212_12180, partial [Xanthomonadales bacterium]|nr:hypothetical protein [Xanthomonadales bacterium]